MENASKALIIAGAILLSILIISLGIMVYNNAKNTVGNANLDKQEIETFNSQWQTYVGSNKTASEVYTMMSAIVASNASESNSGKARFVNLHDSLTASPTPAGIPIAATPFTPQMPPSNRTYTIQAIYGTNGLIVAMEYNKAAAATPTP